ncbi:hypothetical protein LCGC14_2679330, partial [marine sediment metagenome]
MEKVDDKELIFRFEEVYFSESEKTTTSSESLQPVQSNTALKICLGRFLALGYFWLPTALK